MKKISKLFVTLITLALVACSLIPFAGCDNTKWQEVQSVSYNYQGDTRIIRSTCNWKIPYKDITRTEYEDAPEESKIGDKFFDYYEYIDIDRQTFIADADAKIGTVFYGYDWKPSNDGSKVYFYYKYTYESYKLKYVKVNILENDCLEVNYDNEIISISPSKNGYFNNSDLPYEIKYFKN